MNNVSTGSILVDQRIEKIIYGTKRFFEVASLITGK